MLQSQVLCLIKSFQLLCIVYTLKIPAELPSIQPLKFCVPMYLNVALLSLRFDSRYLLCSCYVTSVVSNSVRPHRRQPTQAPLSLGFSRQEHWSGLPFSTPGDLPDLGIKPVSPALAGGFFTTEPPGKLYVNISQFIFTFTC